MLKNIITKFNNFIQWTKKWHFFHVLFVPNTIFVLFTLFISIFLYIWNICFSNNTKAFIFSHDHIFLIWANYTCLVIVFLILAICVQSIFSIINWMKYNTIQLQNQFLLNNRKYNFLYCTAFYCNILYILSLLILIIFMVISFIFMISIADKVMY